MKNTTATGVVSVQAIPIPETDGGTGQLTYTQGDTLYSSAANVLSKLPKDTNATRYLSNTGALNNPAWAQVNLTNGVSGVLPVANGGTATSTAFTQGSVIFAGASGVYSQNNTNLFWDDASKILRVGAAGAGLLGVGISSGGFSSANSVVEFTRDTSKFRFLDNGGLNPVFSLLDTRGSGKAGALFFDTTGGAFIFDSAGSFDFTSDSNANIVANSFGAGISRLRVSTTLVTIPNGVSLYLSGGTTSGQGNIQLGANASAAYDSNILYLDSTAKTMGIIGGSTPAFDAANGPFFAFRGNTYSSIANQRGHVAIGAGNPAAPTGLDGCTVFYSGANVIRLRVSATGQIGMGISNTPTTVTAALHLGAGTATASTAPLKLTTGTDNTVAEPGAFEFSSSRLAFTPSGTTRKRVALTNDATPTNGQIPIGNGTDFTANALLTGAGISVTNGVGVITISVTGGGLTWFEVVGTTQAIGNNFAYITNNAGQVTATLPTTAAVGDLFRIVGKGAGGWLIAQNASQILHVGSTASTTGVGGSVGSINQYDCVEFVCTVANLEWTLLSSVGTLNVA